ncbi:MAG: leucyl aminopeptidase [Solirubrobacterales bacterium]
MKVQVEDKPLADADAGLVAVGLFDGDDLAAEIAAAPGAEDAKGGYKKTEVLHGEGSGRTAVIGLGKRNDWEPERARVAAAIATRVARTHEASSIAWVVPDQGEATAIAAALVDGTILASYRFDRFKSTDDEDDDPRTEIESLTLLADPKLAEVAETARVASEAANRARELQNLPSNVATPSYLATRAEELAERHEKLSVDVLDRKQITAKKMGGLVAVSQGADEEPRLIVLRYEGGGSGGLVGLVGKAVTFDTGGISIKPSGGMQEMKMDMSGGAAVLEAMGAIAELGLPLDVLAVIPATENMPSGHAIKPGDIITQLTGKTVEVNNTDAEGRLILADALAYAVELGAERIVDLATLTGAVLIALGSTYAALISNDDEWAESVGAAGDATGELAWRLPLHPEYKEITKGEVADLTNASEKRKAGTIYAASFLEEFVDGKPWAHLDIAGTAWDQGREYVGKGATGFGVRLLVELAREQSA